MNNKIVALLPMKANSERIKNKNFKILKNKPLYRWILDTLLNISEIDKIVINTDAGDILRKDDIFNTSKILIRERKSELCGDFVSMNLIIDDDINNIEAEHYLMTHTTNPFLSRSTIECAIEKYLDYHFKGKCDSLFTVNRFQTRFYTQQGKAINHDPKILIRTQDLDPYLEENSNLYIFNKHSFELTNARIGNKPILHETPKLESVDLDDKEDWSLAEALSIQY